MSSMTKPIKPRPMWANKYPWNPAPMFHLSERAARRFAATSPTYLARPVLVIDLSPESVEALAMKLAKMHSPNRTPSVGNIWAARHQLSAIGIRAAKGGRK